MSFQGEYLIRVEPWELQSFQHRERYVLKFGGLEMKVSRDELADLHHVLNAAVEIEGGDD